MHASTVTAPAPLHVNLYAGPGVGKTTTALGLAYHLKMLGVHCEYVPEVAKSLLYQGRLHTTPQADIVRNQSEQMSTMTVGRVQVVVTDSPVPLALAYCTPDEVSALAPKIRTFQKGLADCFGVRQLDVLLRRDLSESYQQEGRSQSAQESQAFADNHFNPWVRAWVGESLLELEAGPDTLEVLLARISQHLGLAR